MGGGILHLLCTVYKPHGSDHCIFLGGGSKWSSIHQSEPGPRLTWKSMADYDLPTNGRVTQSTGPPCV